MSFIQVRHIALFFLTLLWLLFILVQYVSVEFNLFWYFWWLDVVMHIYGGILVVTSWFMMKTLGVFPRLVGDHDQRALGLLLFSVIGWEIFKYLFGSITPVGYGVDTVTDLGLGILGGLGSFLLFRSRTIRTS